MRYAALLFTRVTPADLFTTKEIEFMSKYTSILGIAAFALLAGCSQGGATSISAGPDIDQDNLCEVKQWEWDAVKGACKPGQKVAYLPPRFGNEQLPVIFVAVNCDMRYSIALTNGGVACIYKGITPKAAQEVKPAE